MMPSTMIGTTAFCTVEMRRPVRRLEARMALNRVGYRGRIEIVAYGVEAAAHGTEAVIDVLAITRLTPERLAASCRRP